AHSAGEDNLRRRDGTNPPTVYPGRAAVTRSENGLRISRPTHRDEPGRRGLRYERLDTNPLANVVFLPKVVERVFPKLKGVDAKRCKLDTKRKELQIRLAPQGVAKLAEIK